MIYEVEEIERDNDSIIEPEEVEVDLLDEEDILQKFKDELDDLNEDVYISGFTFSPSQVLEMCDPTAFDICLSSREDNLQETETRYICPVCGTEHDYYDDAKFCCQEETIIIYEVDGEEFDSEDDAKERAGELNDIQ